MAAIILMSLTIFSTAIMSIDLVPEEALAHEKPAAENCPNGYTLKPGAGGTAGFCERFEDAAKAKKCPAGFKARTSTADPNDCIKQVPPTRVCPSGFTWSASSSTCTRPADVAATRGACPSTYRWSASLGYCTRPATLPLPSHGPCPSGYTRGSHSCTTTTTRTSPSYTCPSGYSLRRIGTSRYCRTTTTTAAPTYTCPSGYSGPSSTNNCNKFAIKVQVLSCAQGTLTGTKCRITVSPGRACAPGEQVVFTPHTKKYTCQHTHTTTSSTTTTTTTLPSGTQTLTIAQLDSPTGITKALYADNFTVKPSKHVKSVTTTSANCSVVNRAGATNWTLNVSRPSGGKSTVDCTVEAHANDGGVFYRIGRYSWGTTTTTTTTTLPARPEKLTITYLGSALTPTGATFTDPFSVSPSSDISRVFSSSAGCSVSQINVGSYQMVATRPAAGYGTVYCTATAEANDGGFANASTSYTWKGSVTFSGLPQLATAKVGVAYVKIFTPMKGVTSQPSAVTVTGADCSVVPTGSGHQWKLTLTSSTAATKRCDVSTTGGTQAISVTFTAVGITITGLNLAGASDTTQTYTNSFLVSGTNRATTDNSYYCTLNTITSHTSMAIALVVTSAGSVQGQQTSYDTICVLTFGNSPNTIKRTVTVTFTTKAVVFHSLKLTDTAITGVLYSQWFYTTPRTQVTTPGQPHCGTLRDPTGGWDLYMTSRVSGKKTCTLNTTGGTTATVTVTFASPKPIGLLTTGQGDTRDIYSNDFIVPEGTTVTVTDDAGVCDVYPLQATTTRWRLYVEVAVAGVYVCDLRIGGALVLVTVTMTDSTPTAKITGLLAAVTEYIPTIYTRHFQVTGATRVTSSADCTVTKSRYIEFGWILTASRSTAGTAVCTISAGNATFTSRVAFKVATVGITGLRDHDTAIAGQTYIRYFQALGASGVTATEPACRVTRNRTPGQSGWILVVVRKTVGDQDCTIIANGDRHAMVIKFLSRDYILGVDPTGTADAGALYENNFYTHKNADATAAGPGCNIADGPPSGASDAYTLLVTRATPGQVRCTVTAGTATARAIITFVTGTGSISGLSPTGTVTAGESYIRWFNATGPSPTVAEAGCAVTPAPSSFRGRENWRLSVDRATAGKVKCTITAGTATFEVEVTFTAPGIRGLPLSGTAMAGGVWSVPFFVIGSLDATTTSAGCRLDGRAKALQMWTLIVTSETAGEVECRITVGSDVSVVTITFESDTFEGLRLSGTAVMGQIYTNRFSMMTAALVTTDSPGCRVYSASHAPNSPFAVNGWVLRVVSPIAVEVECIVKSGTQTRTVKILFTAKAVIIQNLELLVVIEAGDRHVDEFRATTTQLIVTGTNCSLDGRSSATGDWTLIATQATAGRAICTITAAGGAITREVVIYWVAITGLPQTGAAQALTIWTHEFTADNAGYGLRVIVEGPGCSVLPVSGSSTKFELSVGRNDAGPRNCTITLGPAEARIEVLFGELAPVDPRTGPEVWITTGDCTYSIVVDRHRLPHHPRAAPHPVDTAHPRLLHPHLAALAPHLLRRIGDPPRRRDAARPVALPRHHPAEQH